MLQGFHLPLPRGETGTAARENVHTASLDFRDVSWTPHGITRFILDILSVLFCFVGLSCVQPHL